MKCSGSVVVVVVVCSGMTVDVVECSECAGEQSLVVLHGCRPLGKHAERSIVSSGRTAQPAVVVR